MKRIRNLPTFVKISTLVILLLFAAVALAFRIGSPDTPVDINNPVGLLEKSYTDTGRDRQLETYVWYPTEAIGLVEVYEDNAVFKGFSAIKNAPLKDQKHPLIIMSHGSGGNRGNQGWLAPDLARQGAIVVAANHPGSTSRDSAAATNILAWNRPQDISFLIDSVLADGELAQLIDPERIAVVGHSLGGYTSFAIGGGELSIDQFTQYCQDFPDNPDCAFYRNGEVDFAQVDRSKFEKNYKDDRVSAVVVIDPAYAKAFKAESLENRAPTLLIAPPSAELDFGDLKVDYLAQQAQLGENYIEMSGAYHFTYLPECKPIGYYLLSVVEKDGELLCLPEEGQSRAEYHAETSAFIVDFLQAETILSESKEG